MRITNRPFEPTTRTQCRHTRAFESEVLRKACYVAGALVSRIREYRARSSRRSAALSHILITLCSTVTARLASWCQPSARRRIVTITWPPGCTADENRGQAVSDRGRLCAGTCRAREGAWAIRLLSSCGMILRSRRACRSCRCMAGCCARRPAGS